MDNFNMKQWLQENKVGPYSKTLLNEINPATMGVGQEEADKRMQQQDAMRGTEVDNISMDETVGFADMTKSADSGLPNYMDVLNQFNMQYGKDDTYDQREYKKGVADERELRLIYNNLSDEEKEMALNAFKERSRRYFPADSYSGMEEFRNKLTPDTFDGAGKKY